MPWERLVRQLLEQREQKAAQEHMTGLLSKYLNTSPKTMPPNFKGMLPSSHLYNRGHHKYNHHRTYFDDCKGPKPKNKPIFCPA